MAKTTFADGTTANGSTMHDVGGFDRKKITDLLPLEADAVPVVMITLGFADDAGKLDEPFKTSELAPRSRKAFSEIIFYQP